MNPNIFKSLQMVSNNNVTKIQGGAKKNSKILIDEYPIIKCVIEGVCVNDKK